MIGVLEYDHYMMCVRLKELQRAVWIVVDVLVP